MLFLMIRRPPRSTRNLHTLSLHDALPISGIVNCNEPLAFLLVVEELGRVDMSAAHCFQVHAHSSQLLSDRSEEHTSELQSLMRISYAVFCLKKKNKKNSQRNADNKLFRTLIIHSNIDTTHRIQRTN